MSVSECLQADMQLRSEELLTSQLKEVATGKKDLRLCLITKPTHALLQNFSASQANDPIHDRSSLIVLCMATSWLQAMTT